MNKHFSVRKDDHDDTAKLQIGAGFQGGSALRPATLDVDEPAGALKLRIPDPLSCIPARARRVAGRHHQHRFVTQLTDETPAPIVDWGLGSVTSVVSAPAVTFHSVASTFDFFSVKTRRVHYGIGPHEFAHVKHLEADPYTFDFDLQAIRASWQCEERDHYTADSVALTADGVVVTEVKASESYFQDPEYASVMWNARRAFEAAGMRFAKVTGDAMAANRRRSWNVDRIIGDRGTAFAERHVDAVSALIAAGGGSAPVGRIEEALSVHPSVARQMANAMMCDRHLAYDIDAPVTRDTEVSAAPQPAIDVDIRSIGL